MQSMVVKKKLASGKPAMLSTSCGNAIDVDYHTCGTLLGSCNNRRNQWVENLFDWCVRKGMHTLARKNTSPFQFLFEMFPRILVLFFSRCNIWTLLLV